MRIKCNLSLNRAEIHEERASDTTFERKGCILKNVGNTVEQQVSIY